MGKTLRDPGFEPDDDDNLWIYDDGWTDCWDCGGEGVWGDICECSAVEDTCCCLNPEPMTCKTCRGEGGWNDD